MIEILNRSGPLDPSFEKRLLLYLIDAEKKSKQINCYPLFDLASQSIVKVVIYNTKNQVLNCTTFSLSEPNAQKLSVRRSSAKEDRNYEVSTSDFKIQLSALMALSTQTAVCVNQNISHEPVLIVAIAKNVEQNNFYWYYDFPFEECEVKAIVADMLMMTEN